MSFPLLRELSKLGDADAEEALGTETIKRFESNFPATMNFLLEQGLLKQLSKEKIASLVQCINYQKSLEYSVLETFKLIENLNGQNLLQFNSAVKTSENDS